MSLCDLHGENSGTAVNTNQIVMQIKISTAVSLNMLKHTKHSYPREYCALLFGEVKDDKVYITEIREIKNHARSSRFFLLNKNDIKASKDHLAFFHSHTYGQPVLSKLDKKNFMEISDLWVIGKVVNNQLTLTAYNSNYETIDIKL